MAKDKYHYLVKKALEQEGWIVTHDPFYVQTLKRRLEIDLGAERLIAAEKDEEKIAIEIKTFSGVSDIHEFYKALGQFIYYRLALTRVEPERVLYLAVPSDFYEDFFSEPLSIDMVEEQSIKIIIYDIKNQIIKKWIK